tara:strand:- start:31 stop:615 length:585 start_codon:yes stop_codon:yes gene_type:complete
MANYSKELTTAIKDVDAHFPGKTSSVPIMKFISAAESNYGQYDPETALSYGPFQIDPIRYYDIAQNPERINQPRLDRANEFLRGKLNNPDFNISNLATYNPETKGYDDVNLDMMRNPYVGATLTRLGLMQDPGDLPEEEGLSEYYQDFWGPRWSQSEDEEFKAGKRAEAQDRYDRIDESMMMDNVTNEQGSEAF